MHERFSDRARHAMALANREANRLQHDYLAPAHLMLGLIAEGHCVATEALRVLDVNLDAVRDEVNAQMKQGEANGNVGARVHTKELKEIIRLAIQEARNNQHAYVGTEHLVIGLLAQGDSIPARVLAKQGVDLGKVREEVLTLLKAASDPTSDLQHSRHGHFEWVHQEELAKAFRSPSFWHTMILAVDAANRLGASEVTPQHLLLALLRDPNNGVSGMLAERGITAETLKEQLANG